MNPLKDEGAVKSLNNPRKSGKKDNLKTVMTG